MLQACRNMRIQDMEKRLQSYAENLKTIIRIIDYGTSQDQWQDTVIDVTGMIPSKIQAEVSERC